MTPSRRRLPRRVRELLAALAIFALALAAAALSARADVPSPPPPPAPAEGFIDRALDAILNEIAPSGAPHVDEDIQADERQAQPAARFKWLTASCVACDLAATVFETGTSLAAGMSSELARSGFGALVGAGLMVTWLFRIAYMFLTGQEQWRRIVEEAASLFAVTAVLSTGAFGFFVDWILSPAMWIASGLARAAFNGAGAALGTSSCSTAGLVGPAAIFDQLQDFVCVLSSLNKIVAAGLVMGLTIVTHISIFSMFFSIELVQVISGFLLLVFFGFLMALFIFAAVEITWDLVIGAALFPVAAAAWPFAWARRSGSYGIRLLVHGLVHLVLLAIGAAIASEIMSFALTSYLASAAKSGGGFAPFGVLGLAKFDAAFAALQSSSTGIMSVGDSGYWWAVGSGVVIWITLRHSRSTATSIATVAAATVAAGAASMVARAGGAAVSGVGAVAGGLAGGPAGAAIATAAGAAGRVISSFMPR